MSRTVIVTGADHQQMPWLTLMLESLRALPGGRHWPVYCLDLGLQPADRRQLQTWDVACCAPAHQFALPPGTWPAWMQAYLAQPFMREWLPGWQTYLWIDADIWFQSPAALEAALAGAQQHGLAIAHERCPSYRWQPWLQAWLAKHFIKGFGLIEGLWLWSRPHLNSGFYALAADAPHWQPWAAHYQAAMTRAGRPSPYGQLALNRVVYGAVGRRGVPFARLAPQYNWICDRRPPMWHDATQRFCLPRPPYDTLPTLHLAGPGKHTTYVVRRTGGGAFATRIVPGAQPD